MFSKSEVVKANDISSELSGLIFQNVIPTEWGNILKEVSVILGKELDSIISSRKENHESQAKELDYLIEMRGVIAKY